MLPLFMITDRSTYSIILPQHLSDLLSRPTYIINNLRLGGFSVSLSGTSFSLALDECHESTINFACENLPCPKGVLSQVGTISNILTISRKDVTKFQIWQAQSIAKYRSKVESSRILHLVNYLPALFHLINMQHQDASHDLMHFHKNVGKKMWPLNYWCELSKFVFQT